MLCSDWLACLGVSLCFLLWFSVPIVVLWLLGWCPCSWCLHVLSPISVCLGRWYAQVRVVVRRLSRATRSSHAMSLMFFALRFGLVNWPCLMQQLSRQMMFRSDGLLGPLAGGSCKAGVLATWHCHGLHGITFGASSTKASSMWHCPWPAESHIQ